MRVAGVLDSLHEARIVVGDLIRPFLMNIPIPRPAILELGSSRQAVWRRVKVSALVERRIGGDEVYGLRIHGAQEHQIVAVK